MKKIFFLFLAILFLGFHFLGAQNTDGTNFWLTYGYNYLSHNNDTPLDLQIRIVNRALANHVTIKFSELGIPDRNYYLSPREVLTFSLSADERNAVYNTTQGISSKSVNIISDEFITAYALNQTNVSADATNLLPMTALGTKYYNMSYVPYRSNDAYAVVATKNNTTVYHNGMPVGVLNKGELYYRTNSLDMTGDHITASDTIAFFAMNQDVEIPSLSGGSGDVLFQQLAPLNRLGKKYFVPVSDLRILPTYENTKNRIRVMALKPNTVFITPPTDATLITNTGGQSPISKPLNVGEFFELEIYLNHNGTFFETNNAVGVCCYLTSRDNNNGVFSDPAQAWLPSMEQMAKEGIISPFVPPPGQLTALTAHNALIVTPLNTKMDTQVSINGGNYGTLSGGNWFDNITAQMSFYVMPLLTDADMSYSFRNPGKLFIMGYGTGDAESYYYLAYSAMYAFDVAFYANDIHYEELPNVVFCSNDIYFSAEVEDLHPDPGSLRWFIDGIEELTKTDSLEWSQHFDPGQYQIEMRVVFSDGTSRSIESILKVGVHISAEPTPSDGGTVTGEGCYEIGETALLNAIPATCFQFQYWTIANGTTPISTNPSLPVIVSADSSFVAHFDPLFGNITLSVLPLGSGTAVGADSNLPCGEQYTVTAIPSQCWRFVNWRDENGNWVSNDATFTFILTGDTSLVAHFEPLYFDVIVLADPPGGGNVVGGGIQIPCGNSIDISASYNSCTLAFLYWADLEGNVVSTDISFVHGVFQDTIFVAHFSTITYDVLAEPNPPAGGSVSGQGLGLPCGSNVTMIATAETCYEFMNWTDQNNNWISNNPTFSFLLSQDTSFIAHFDSLFFDVIATAQPVSGGVITGDGTNIPCGTNITVTATANTGFSFLRWTDENNNQLSINPSLPLLVTENHTLIAHFAADPSNIIVNANPWNGGMAIGNSYNVPYGEERTVTATPFMGWHFVNWTNLDGTEASTLATYTFVVTGSRTLTANFVRDSYQITTEPITPDMGTTSGDGTFVGGTLVTVTATPFQPLYRFVNWTENGTEVSQESEYSFPITRNRHLEANFAIQDFTVVVLPYPIIGGQVFGGGQHIPFGQLITVTASPNFEWAFVNWTIDGVPVCADTDFTFNVIESVTAVANFRLKNCNILVWASPGQGGQVTGDTLNIPYGALHTVTATPNPNYHFVNWTEDGVHVSGELDYTFIVLRSRNLVANFTYNLHDINLPASPTQGGMVTGGGIGIVHGTVINALAAPNPHFLFKDWTENGIPVCTDPLYTFTATSSRDLVANFVSELFTVTLSADPPDAGTVSGGGDSIPYGTVITVIATPDSCHHFEYWSENGDTVSYTPEYTFEVSGNHHLIAHFSIKTFTIITSESPSLSGTTYGGGTNIICGTEVTVVAIADVGYRFINWTENGVPVSDTTHYTFTALEDRDLVANFFYVTYTITLEPDLFYMGNVYDSGVYELNLELTVKAVANPEYSFVNWTEGEDTVSMLADYIFIVDRDRHLVAHFEDVLYEVSLSACPNWGGVVTGDTIGLHHGDWHTITATPNQYFRFVNWTREDGSLFSIHAIDSFPVNSNLNLCANFEPETCVITLEARPGGGGLLYGAGVFSIGYPDTLKAFPTHDYVFWKWTTEADSLITFNSIYPFTVLNSQHFVAHFTLKGFLIDAQPLPFEGGSVSGGGVYQHGETATLTAKENPNYVFVNWTENGGEVATVNPYIFTVTQSRNLKANFRLRYCNVIIDREPETGGWVEGGGNNIPWGTEITIIAHPYNDYNFRNWMEEDEEISVMPTHTFTVKRDYNIVAHFTPKMYKITLSAQPNPGGTVSGAGEYAFLDSATIKATPHEGYVFVNWTENDEPLPAAGAEYTFVVNRSRNLVAHFEFAKYNIILTAEPTDGGTVVGTEYNVPHGTVKTVIAIPDSLWHFVYWTEDGEIASDDAEYKFTVTRTRFLVAHFSTVTHVVTLFSLPPDGGTVTGAGNIPHGKMHKITATPNGCYEFVRWTEWDSIPVSNVPEYEFEVLEDRTFMAHFRKTNVNITTSASPTDGGTVVGTHYNVVCGTPVKIEAYPNDEYTFVNWTRNGIEFDTKPILTFPAENGHFVANFAINKYTITLLADPPNLGSVSGEDTYSYGEEITVKASPKEGYSLISWTENDAVVSLDKNYKFRVEKSRTLVAHFDKTRYTVIAEPNDTVYGNVRGGGVFDLYDFCEVKAFPKQGYLFANWTINDTIVSSSPTYEFFVTRSLTIIANFYGLDFDTYAGTLWDNTFLLNLNKLEKKGYDVVGCKWFKNGKEEKNTHTIDQFSYSAGPLETDLLELAPTYYMFQVTTRDGTLMYSTKKLLTEYQFDHDFLGYKLMVYPNPVWSGETFNLMGVVVGEPIEVYSQYGICVLRATAKNELETMSLSMPAGVYFIRNNYRTTKVTVIK